MDIQITPETSISISELAFDEHVPSIKLMIEIEIKSEIFRLIRFDCWFECGLIDDFFYFLIQKRKASISDFDGDFFVSINNNKVSWKYIKRSIIKLDGYFSFEGEEVVLDNVRDRLLEALGNYPKWW